MKAHLTPLSPKAKNRFANQMASDPIVEVEQIKDTGLFVVSSNRQYCAWISTPLCSDWSVTFPHDPPKP